MKRESYFAGRGTVLLLCLTLISTGCSTFHRDWKKAGLEPAPSAGIAGRWDGSWRSEVNGHHGRLRCLVTKTEAGKYQARFHANFWTILSFGYTVPLASQDVGGEVKFQGSADLGKSAGGEYRYDGRANATNFFSRYNSAADHGTFQLTRPSAER